MARSRIGMQTPRILATPQMLLLDFGIEDNFGQRITSRTLNTLIPYSCWLLKRNSNSSSLFLPTSWLLLLIDAHTPVIHAPCILVGSVDVVLTLAYVVRCII